MGLWVENASSLKAFAGLWTKKESFIKFQMEFKEKIDFIIMLTYISHIIYVIYMSI